MIIVKLSGGLGNQMFQYATGLSIALKNNVQLKIDTSVFRNNNHSDTPREFDLGKFNCDYTQATDSEIESIKFPFGPISKLLSFFNKKIRRKFFLDYHPEVLIAKNNKYLDGFFQSERNFSEITPEIKKRFSLRQEYIEIIPREIIEQITTTSSVSVHIRRGDYALDKKTNEFHGLCPVSYYEEAISLIASKIDTPHFYIFSDDIEWVENNLAMSHPRTFVSDGKLIPQQEMHLMSKCKHNIIANSTFSWWGAWLNENPDKIVIAPKKWVNIEPNPHPNIIPKTWITI